MNMLRLPFCINAKPKYFLNPGFVYVSETPVKITTILGSCVSICLYDRRLAYGGMNHYLLPFCGSEAPTSKYGDVAISALLDTFADFGSEASDLEAWIVGGASFSGTHDVLRVGEQNISVARTMLAERSIKIRAMEVGGTNGRRITMESCRGTVSVKYLKRFEYQRDS